MDNPLLAPFLFIQGGIISTAVKAFAQGIQQLTDDYGGRQLLIVADTLSAVGDHQLLSRGEDGLEETIAVLFPQGAIAGSRLAPGEIEVEGSARFRVIAVVHSHETDNPEGDASHRDHGAEGDPRSHSAG